MILSHRAYLYSNASTFFPEYAHYAVLNCESENSTTYITYKYGFKFHEGAGTLLWYIRIGRLAP